MAGVVYLRTNRFEVKLEGITFKAKDFETLCTVDFLFPDGKIWARPPIVGLDVMRHPRDASVILLLLGIGAGCVILRFHAGGSLPNPIYKFLTDERIRFVGFGIRDKRELFPFEELGLSRKKVDISYLAAKHLNNPKYKRSDLGELASKVLGIKRMIGLADASSFERHEQVKCAICQLFITNAIAMALFDPQDNNKLNQAPKESSFLKSFNSLPVFTEGWFRLPKGKNNNNKSQTVTKSSSFQFPIRFRHHTLVDNINVKTKYDPLIYAKDIEESSGDDSCQSKHVVGLFGDDLGQGKGVEGKGDDCSVHINGKESTASNDAKTDAASPRKTPVKGILKSPSSNRLDICKPDSPPPVKEQSTAGKSLRRANSKGCKVSFKCH